MLKKILLSCFAIFGLTFFLSSNSYAVSDITYTATANSNSGYTFCGSNTGVSCSDYHYLLITTNYGFNTTTSYASMVFSYNNASQSAARLYLNSPSLLLDTSDFTVIAANNINNTAPLPSDWSVTFTLSENNPAGGITPEGSLSITSNGTYDVTNYASAVVDVNTTNTWVVELFKDGFWGIMTALVALIVPVLVLFLIFRLVHDWLWGKG